MEATKEELFELPNIAGCRALGIIDKLITGPYWRKCESVPNILDLNEIVQELQNNCIAWANDASPLLYEEKPGFTGADIHKDNIYEALFRESDDPELDAKTIWALELIMIEFCKTISNQMKDVLEGGNLHNPSEELRQQTKDAPTTNNVSERVFGAYDRHMRERPNATTLNLESTILFETNKTGAWLGSLEDTTKKHYMEMARKTAKTVRKNYLERKAVIEERIRQNLLLRQKQNKEKENKKIEKTRSIIAELHKYGGEWNLDNLDQKLCMVTTKLQKDALKTQINYHRYVLESKHPQRNLFNQSEGKINFSIDKLKNNLIEIIKFSTTSTFDAPENHDYTIIPADEMARKYKLRKQELMLKLQNHMAKKINKNNKTSSKPKSQRKKNNKDEISPEEFVNRKVDHIFEIEEDGKKSEIAYSGIITKIVKQNYNNPRETVFEIKYDSTYNDDDDSDDEGREEDEEDTYEYTLMHDYFEGNLIFTDD